MYNTVYSFENDTELQKTIQYTELKTDLNLRLEIVIGLIFHLTNLVNRLKLLTNLASVIGPTLTTTHL